LDFRRIVFDFVFHKQMMLIVSWFNRRAGIFFAARGFGRVRPF